MAGHWRLVLAFPELQREQIFVPGVSLTHSGFIIHSIKSIVLQICLWTLQVGLQSPAPPSSGAEQYYHSLLPAAWEWFLQRLTWNSCTGC
jgi:hypothetical protein